MAERHKSGTTIILIIILAVATITIATIATTTTTGTAIITKALHASDGRRRAPR